MTNKNTKKNTKGGMFSMFQITPTRYLKNKIRMKKRESTKRERFLVRTLSNQTQRKDAISTLKEERYNDCKKSVGYGIIEELNYIKDNFSGSRMIKGLIMLINFLEDIINVIEKLKLNYQNGGNAIESNIYDTITKTYFLEYTRKKNLQLLLQNTCNIALLENIEFNLKNNVTKKYYYQNYLNCIKKLLKDILEYKDIDTLFQETISNIYELIIKDDLSIQQNEIVKLTPILTPIIRTIQTPETIHENEII
jgi:hypothetical protein